MVWAVSFVRKTNEKGRKRAGAVDGPRDEAGETSSAANYDLIKVAIFTDKRNIAVFASFLELNQINHKTTKIIWVIYINYIDKSLYTFSVNGLHK